MFDIFITVKMNNTKTCENKGHVLTDTSNGTKTFISLSSTDATNVVAHNGGMFIFQGTFCLIHFANTYFNIKHVKYNSPVKQPGVLADYKFAVVLVYWCYSFWRCTVQKEKQSNK